MSTTKPSLTDFLLARIAEDEDHARACLTDSMMTWREEDWAEIGEPSRSHVEAWAPSRVLAECEAKRRIIADRRRIDASSGDTDWHSGYSDGNYDALRALAVPYADHPDFDPAWRA